MTSIEQTIHNGSVNALKIRVEALQHQLRNAWDDTRRDGAYVRLGAAIAKGRALLDDMEETLKALRKLEPSNQ